jgi:hypothetical protein
MFQEPKKYSDNDHFFFESKQDLEKNCNAPNDKDGIFKVLELRNGKEYRNRSNINTFI